MLMCSSTTEKGEILDPLPGCQLGDRVHVYWEGYKGNPPPLSLSPTHSCSPSSGGSRIRKREHTVLQVVESGGMPPRNFLIFTSILVYSECNFNIIVQVGILCTIWFKWFSPNFVKKESILLASVSRPSSKSGGKKK